MAELTELTARVSGIDDRLDHMDKRFDAIDQRFEAVLGAVAAEGQKTRLHFDVVAEQMKAPLSAGGR